MSRPDTWQDERRATAIYGFHCHAHEGYFVWPLRDAPLEVKTEININGPIPCEGSGDPGSYCAECRFGEVSIEA